MKKTLLLITLACGISAASYAQGTFQWSSPSAAFVGFVSTNTWSPFIASSGNPAAYTVGVTNGLARGSGTQPLYYTLLTSSALNSLPTSLSQFSGTLATAWLQTGMVMTNTTGNAGRMAAVGGPNTAYVSQNWAGGSTQNSIVVGWSSNLGTTWADALTKLNSWNPSNPGVTGIAWFGVGAAVWSGVNPGTSDPGTPINWASLGSSATLQPLYVAPVPEPSTLALAGLGGLALLALRRRK